MGCHFLLQGSSWPRDRTCIPALAGGFFPTEPPEKPLLYMHLYLYMECISLAISANGNLYMYLYMRSLYIYISIETYLHKLFYIHHWQRNCCFYSIQITLEHFLKKSFVDREIQIKEKEITERNIIWLYCHYADCTTAHNNALFLPCCNWHLCTPFSESPLEMQLCQSMMIYFSTWNWTSAFGNSPMRQTWAL